MSKPFQLLAVVEGIVIVALGALLLTRQPGDAPPSGQAPAQGDKQLALAPVPRTDAPSRPSEQPQPSRASEPAVERVAVTKDGPTALPGTLLCGRVVAADGSAVKDASIYATRAGERRGSSAAVNGGGYALPGLEAGKYKLRTRAEGFKAAEADVEVTGDQVQRLDLTLDRAFLIKVAIVTPDKQPLAKALTAAQMWRAEPSVVATVEEPPAAFPMTEHRTLLGIGVGEWRSSRFERGGERGDKPPLPERFAGILEVQVPPPVWVSVVNRHVVVGKALAQPGQDEVEIVVSIDDLKKSLARVRLQVVATESGAPLAEASVGIWDRQTGGGGQKVAADGTITIENVAPGIGELEIRAKDREFFRRDVRIAPGADLDLGRVAVDPATKLSGTISSADGKAAAGAQIACLRLDHLAPDSPLDSRMGLSSNAEGKFEYAMAGRGRYRMTARTETAVATTVVDTTSGPVADIELKLAPATTVQLVNKLPKTKTCMVRIEDKAGMPVFATNVRPGQSYPLTSLLPGTYHVQLLDDGKPVRAFALSVGTTPVTIEVP